MPELKKRVGPSVPQLALDMDPVATLRADLDSVGLVGESDNAVLVYLAYLSRLLEEPTAVISRGPSSSGKSTLLKRVIGLFPPASRIEAMEMSSAAWFRTEPNHFRRKIFLSGERKHSTDDKTRDAGALLRQLLSEKRINRSLCMRDPESQEWYTAHIEREGPIAYAESTTSESVFEEDLNRMLQVYTDDSPAQTRRVMIRLTHRYDPAVRRPRPEEATARHREYQEYLEQLPARPVYIPYARRLAERMPCQRTEMSRATQQVLTVIEASAVYQQHMRSEHRGGILATADDYALARGLLQAPLHAAIGVGETLYEKAAAVYRVLGNRVFTQGDVRRAIGGKYRMDSSRVVQALILAGLVVLDSAGSGPKGDAYRWVKGRDPDTMLLPTVESVMGA